MKSKFQQIIYDMRHQPVIAWVTFLATALSVFLIMVVVMMQRAKTVPFPPESCRDHLLIGANLHTEQISNPSNNSSAGLSYATAKLLYDGLQGVEQMSYFTFHPEVSEVYAKGSDFVTADSRRTDAEFFKIFDHTLIEGRYYTPQEADALMPLAVISEDVARRTLGDAPWTGRDIIIDNNPFTVIGVIRNNSSLAATAHGDVFTPTGPADTRGQWTDLMGSIAVALKIEPGVSHESIRRQVKARYSVLDAQLGAEDLRSIYHQQPYDQEQLSVKFMGSNTTPDPGPERRMRLVIYGILLIVPAINLSSMLHSRLRRRINDIGVRRAFGCTRSQIITDIVTENLIVTLAGGIVGVALGIIFASTYSGLYETAENMGRGDTPSIAAFLNWGTIITALIVCFILNILSASLPAWQASRMAPVDALNRK